MEDINNIQMRPVLRWAYGPNDGNLNGTVGSAIENSPFPEPISGNQHFTLPLTISMDLSGKINE
jgi:hypothetical protein